MNEKNLNEKTLGLSSPWCIMNLNMNISAHRPTVKTENHRNTRFRCPECNKHSRINAPRIRRWPHLPTCQFSTIIDARIPRVNYSLEHDLHLVPVSSTKESCFFSALFEWLVILWLKEASINAVAYLMDLICVLVDAILTPAVNRDVSGREVHAADSIVSYKKILIL